MRTKIIITIFALAGILPFSFSQGLINNGATLIVSNNAYLNVNSNYTNSGNGKIDLKGNMKITGNWSNNSLSSDVFVALSTGQFTMAGSSNQIIGGSTATKFGNVTINNNNGVTLQRSTNILGNLTMTSGNITLVTNNLSLSPTSNISGTFSATNMIVADSTGQLIRGVAGNGSVLFPIGDNKPGLDYSPVTLNFTSGTYSNATAGVRVVDRKHPNNGSISDYISRYWTVTQSGISNFSCNATFNYLPSDIVGTEANIMGSLWNGTKWSKLNSGSSNSITGTTTQFGDFSGVNKDIYTGISDHMIKGISVYTSPGTIYVENTTQDPINGELIVYNVLGQEVYRKRFDNSGTNIISVDSHNNFYLVKIQEPQKAMLKKIFVK